MTDAVQAGRGLVDYPGVYPISTGYVLANISGNTALPYPVALADLAAAIGTPTYQGTWNASTNTPTLVSSVGVSGGYYVVSVAGTTNLNGITDWSVGDWAIFNGTTSTWQKIEGGATSLAVGSSGITGGATTRILYDNAGVLGEYTITGSGTIVVMAASPTFTGTPILPTPFTIGAVSMTATGTQLNYLSSATGTTGTTSTNVVFSTSPSLVTPVLGAATGTSLALGGAAIGGNALAVTGSIIGSSTITLQGAVTGVAGTSGSSGWAAADVSGNYGALRLSGVGAASGNVIGWTGSTTNAFATFATGLSQISGGIVAVGTGANGSIAGGMQMATLALGGATIGANALAVTGSANVSGATTALSYQSGAPSGGTAGVWKLGIRVAATVILDTTQYVQADIGGTLYKLAIAS